MSFPPLSDARAPRFWLPFFAWTFPGRLFPGIRVLILCFALECALVFGIALGGSVDLSLIADGTPHTFILGRFGLVVMYVAGVILDTDSRGGLLLVWTVEERGHGVPPCISLGGELTHLYLTKDFGTLLLNSRGFPSGVTKPLVPLG